MRWKEEQREKCQGLTMLGKLRSYIRQFHHSLSLSLSLSLSYSLLFSLVLSCSLLFSLSYLPVSVIKYGNLISQMHPALYIYLYIYIIFFSPSFTIIFCCCCRCFDPGNCNNQQLKSQTIGSNSDGIDKVETRSISAPSPRKYSNELKHDNTRKVELSTNRFVQQKIVAVAKQSIT